MTYQITFAIWLELVLVKEVVIIIVNGTLIWSSLSYWLLLARYLVRVMAVVWRRIQYLLVRKDIIIDIL